MARKKSAKPAETNDDSVKEFARQVKAADKPKIDGIAILGSHPATVEQAPFDANWLIYACSPHNIEMRTLPRVDQWFEVHLPVTHPTREYEYLRRLEDNNVAQNPMHCNVIWARDKQFLARCKDGREYPQEELTKRFGPFFWTSSIAFILAKAIVDCEELGIDKIGIFGVMQASENEYTYQRPGIQYFIQRAIELGIGIVIPPESKLCDPQQVEF